MRDTSKCKTLRACDYMTSDQEQAFRETWNDVDYYLREQIGAPDWAHFVDREGTAYSIQALAEEWLMEGKGEGDAPTMREVMVAIAPVAMSNAIVNILYKRIEAGELRALVDSPEEMEA